MLMLVIVVGKECVDVVDDGDGGDVGVVAAHLTRNEYLQTTQRRVAFETPKTLGAKKIICFLTKPLYVEI